MIGYSEKRHDLAPFRVDRMAIPEILEEAAVENTSFNPADYANKVIQTGLGLTVKKTGEFGASLCCSHSKEDTSCF